MQPSTLVLWFFVQFPKLSYVKLRSILLGVNHRQEFLFCKKEKKIDRPVTGWISTNCLL